MSEHDHMLLAHLRDALTTGDPDTILAALPEPPNFLPALFRSEPSERDAIIVGIWPALTGDEDRWEIIEATVMHLVAHADSGAFVTIAPLIPESLMEDTRLLVASIREAEPRRIAEKVLQERAS